MVAKKSNNKKKIEKQMRLSVERKKPEILSIQELLNREYSFFVPGYQRGYRWGEEQAKALIKDLVNYYESQVEGKVNINSIPPYYLQPIYVKKKNEKEYEVIDGQQRLTTIWLLLYVLNNKKENHVENPFVINYETRNEWYKDFLRYANKDIADDEFEKKNLDFFHVAEVYRTFLQNITKRSTQSPNNIKGEILKDILLNHVKIIWSEIPTNVSNDNINDVIDSFTNINSGKIKLTCAELIKAVFLQQNIYWSIGTKSDESITDPEKRLEQAVRSLFKNTQQANSTRDRIAREWDEIERMLGNDKFWYFIYDKECGQLYDTRIEYIFNLVVGVERGADPMQAFTKIYNELAEKKDADDQLGQLGYINNIWKEVKKYVDTLYNWWMDKEMYHKIGYLICTAPWISTSVKEDEEDEKTKEKTKKTSVVSYLMSGLYKEGWSKHKLKEEIRQRIIDTFEFVEKQEDDTYDIPEQDESFTYSRRENIRKALLFFNIDTLLKQKGDDRFAFDKYKTESWDIEHIASQTDFNFKDASAKEEWCLALLQYFTGIDINEITIEEEGKYSKIIRKYCPDKESFISDCINKLPDGKKKEFCEYLLACLKEGKLDSEKAKDYVKGIFGENEITSDDKHLIGNLTLLHMSINRGYGNAVFPVKRMKVIQGAEEGYYVPICTQKVFQKAYSRQLDQLYTWTKADFEAYGNAVKKTILDFCNNNNKQL